MEVVDFVVVEEEEEDLEDITIDQILMIQNVVHGVEDHLVQIVHLDHPALAEVVHLAIVDHLDHLHIISDQI